MALVVAALLPFATARAQDAESGYLVSLKQRAREAHLAEEPEWRALLHLVGGSGRSMIDDARFFLSPGGATDPVAELDATLDGLFAPSKTPDEHVWCRYPARGAFLDSALALDRRRVSLPECPSFRSWRDTIAPAGLTLVFPAAWLNNPASAFGHTLLRIDQADATEESRLLAYTANYAAETHGEGVIPYALKGVLGGFDGFFSVAPYYKKVDIYSDLEHRDIWEYRLNFTQSEVEQIVRHLWELRGVAFDYYYFDENCSYQLLSLLDVARPSLQLQARFHGWVIPVDTIREVLSEQGMLLGTAYRPSAGTTLRFTLEQADGALARKAKDAVDARSLEPLRGIEPAERRARALQIAYDYLRYTQVRDRLKTEEVETFGYQLLRERSALRVRLPKDEPPTPSVSPDRGHETFKYSIATGAIEDLPYYELAVRPAYHDLLDPEGGYPQGSELRFFEGAVRHREGEGVELERFIPLAIRSFTPVNELMTPKSWAFEAAVEREWWSREHQPLVTRLDGGLGRTYQLGEEAFVYGLLEPRVQASSRYRSTVTAGGGVETGVAWYPTSKIGLLVDGEVSRLALGDDITRAGVDAGQRYTLDRNWAVRLSERRRREHTEWSTEIELALEWFHG